MLVGGLSAEFEWQQVSSGLQYLSILAILNNAVVNLDGFYSSSDFQFHQSLFQAFGDHHPHVLQLS